MSLFAIVFVEQSFRARCTAAVCGLVRHVFSNQVHDDAGSIRKCLVSRDDGIRADANIGALSKLRPAFEASGSTTAGKLSMQADLKDIFCTAFVH